MECQPTKTPERGDVDIDALRARYAAERDRRMRGDGTAQYIRGTDDETYAHDPHMAAVARPVVKEEIDVAVLGGGWSGILAAYHLRQAGVSNFRVIDHAGDFGGVWYWNRYPGVQCDNDAYCYLPLLEETGFLPSKKFADGHEIQSYARLVADKFGLYDGALFHTLVKALRWDERIRRWRVSTDRGDEILARFVIMANGLLNVPKLPGIPGIGRFKRKLFHTSRWDYEYTGGSWQNPTLGKLRDKRVAIVGTGATAIQAVPFLGKYAKQLYVLQRTPSAVDARPNPPTDATWSQNLESGWQQQRIANFQHAAIEGLRPGEPDLICDFWTEIGRNLQAKMEARGWPQLSLQEFLKEREVEDYLVMERMRRRIDGLVSDKGTAEALKPYFRFACKRPLSNNDYYDTFNRPNASLIDVSDACGVEGMTERGFLHRGKEIEVDCFICASGFEVTSDWDRRWGIDTIEGRDRQSIYEVWGRDVRTLHGMTSRGFPNLFFIGLYQGGMNATIPETFNRQGQHIAYMIKEALKRGLTSLEPSLTAQDAWVEHIRATAFDISELQRECTPSYFNNEGDASKGSRWYLGEAYGPGWDAFQTLLSDWRAKGDLEGLELIGSEA